MNTTSTTETYMTLWAGAWGDTKDHAAPVGTDKTYSPSTGGTYTSVCGQKHLYDAGRRWGSRPEDMCRPCTHIVERRQAGAHSHLGRIASA